MQIGVGLWPAHDKQGLFYCILYILFTFYRKLACERLDNGCICCGLIVLLVEWKVLGGGGGGEVCCINLQMLHCRQRPEHVCHKVVHKNSHEVLFSQLLVPLPCFARRKVGWGVP